MSEQKPEYHILSRRSYHELEYDLNALAAEGYELVGHSLGSQDIYPSVVLRLRLDAQLMPRLDELLALAEQVRNERVDLEARIKALEAALSRYQDTHAETHKYLDARAADVERRLDSHGSAFGRLDVQIPVLRGIVATQREYVQGGTARLTEAEKQIDLLRATLHTETQRLGVQVEDLEAELTGLGKAVSDLGVKAGLND